MKTFQSQPEFVSVQVRVSVLKQLLLGEKIHVCDLHGMSLEHKQCLQQLLLQTLGSADLWCAKVHNNGQQALTND